MKDRRCNRILR